MSALDAGLPAGVLLCEPEVFRKIDWKERREPKKGQVDKGEPQCSHLVNVCGFSNLLEPCRDFATAEKVKNVLSNHWQGFLKVHRAFLAFQGRLPTKNALFVTCKAFARPS